MIKTFTHDDLIRYIYHETTEEENREISKALLCESELRAAYTSLCAIKKEMDDAQMEPAPSTVLSILNYSRSTQVQKKT